MGQTSRLLSEVRFGAFLAYSPRGTSEVSKNSRVVRDVVKYVQPERLRRVCDRLQRDFASTPLDAVLGEDVMLVPAPRSVPLAKGRLWPARQLAEELRARRLGNDVVPLVTRARTVRKSAYAAIGARPTPQEHLDSLAIESVLANPVRITVVDDIVTKGATLLAVASLIAAHFPEAAVSAFAMLRTLGLRPEVDTIVAPCVGSITLTAGGDAWRSP
jgi:hypothetical protein